MSERESSSSVAPNGPAQTEETSTMPEATPTKSDDKAREACLKKVELWIEDVKTGKRDWKDGEKLLAAIENPLEPENKSGAESNDERKRWDDAGKEFVKKYSQNLGDYQALKGNFKEKCEAILKEKAIPHQETSTRAKDIGSVEDKIKRETPALRKKGDRTDAMTQLYRRIVDLAGVRILVYFPNDVSRVVEAIKDSGEFDIVDSVVSFSRRRVDSRNEDKLKQMEGADLNYSDGPWMEKSLSTDEIVHRWKNSGYRAAHLHVRLKQKEEEGEFPQLHKNKIKLIIKTGNSEQIASTQGPDTRGEGKGMKPSPCPNVSFPGFEFPERKIAEIQITTVVMHAWSQVEHDVIYKNPLRIPINDSMTRMLDGVNGLSINSEILLEELRQTLIEAQEEAKKKEFEEFDSRTFAEFLEEYIKNNDDWKADSSWLSVLSWVYGRLSEINPSPYPEFVIMTVSEIATPAKLRNFIEEHGILKKNPEMWEKQDLAIALLKALGVQFREALLGKGTLDEYRRLSFNSTWKFLCVANAFSIMVAIDGQAAISKFKEQYDRDRIEHLRQINAIVLCLPGVPPRGETLDPLMDFADDFIEGHSYETQTIAVALATLQCYVVIEEEWGVAEQLKPHSYSDLEGSGEFQPVFFHTSRSYRYNYGSLILGNRTRDTYHHRLYFIKELSTPIKSGLGFRVLRWGGTSSKGIQYQRKARMRHFATDEPSILLQEITTALSQ